MLFKVILIKDPEGGYTVRVPALPGCVTEGDTVEEALTNAREAIQVTVEEMAEHGEAPLEELLVTEVEAV